MITYRKFAKVPAFAGLIAIAALAGAPASQAANVEGQLDPTFGSGGRVVVPFDVGGGLYDEATAVDVQPDGKIIVAGNVRLTGGGLNGVGLVRLMPDGSLDASFGSGGKRVFGMAPDASLTANQVIVQPDGKILIAGSYGGDDDTPGFFLTRFNADGVDTDHGFGPYGQGSVIVTGYHVDPRSRPMALAEDGSIFMIASVDSGPAEGRNIIVYKYNSQGFEGSFGYTSLNLSRGGDHWDIPQAIGIQQDGKVVVAADSNTDTGSEVSVVRLEPDTGALDTGFNGVGIAYVSLPGGCQDQVGAMQITRRDSSAGGSQDIWIAGTHCITNAAPFLADLDDNGQLSTNFNAGNVATLSPQPGYSNQHVVDLVAQHTWAYGLSLFNPVGPILISGGNSIAYNNNVDMLLTRLLPDSNQRDTTFGVNGDQVVYFNHVGGGLGDDWPSAAIRYGTSVHPVGYLLMVGSVQQKTPSTSNSDFAIVRLLMRDKVYGNGFD